jgi:hypothetical protein
MLWCPPQRRLPRRPQRRQQRRQQRRPQRTPMFEEMRNFMNFGVLEEHYSHCTGCTALQL